MKPRRTLLLKKETLATLGSDELRHVAGAEAGPACRTLDTCLAISDNIAVTLCDCLTQWCSIDVC